MNEEGPPQEGLDPKLKDLTDLAPADEVDAVVEDSIMQFGAIGSPDDISVAPAVGQHQDQPPQVGQDPKLVACVNDGVESIREEDTIAGAPKSAAPDIVENVSTGHAVPAAGMPDRNGGQTDSSSYHATDRDTITAADSAGSVTATMPAVHREPAENTIEEGAIDQSVKASSNANPNLTSSESLAEWNRIHADTGPNYGFFKKSRGGLIVDASENTKKASGGGLPPDIEKLIESSRARSAASTTFPGYQKPLFTLDANGVPISDPTASAESLPYPAHSAPIRDPSTNPSNSASASLPITPLANTGGTNSNFWLQEEEERFLLGLRLYGWGQWKRIQTIVQTRTNKQIKSHAQKREKINPLIKTKYGKGKSRRGRISSKVLAEDARAMAIAGGSVGEVANRILSNDSTIPSLDQAWRDVYDTNNTDGPNSRTRRYRHHLKLAGNVSNGSNQLALLELSKPKGADGTAPQFPTNMPRRTLEESLSNPLLKQPTAAPMEKYHQHMEATKLASGMNTADVTSTSHDLHTLPQQQDLNTDRQPSQIHDLSTIHQPPRYPPLGATAAAIKQDDQSYSSTPFHLPHEAMTIPQTSAMPAAINGTNKTAQMTMPNATRPPPSKQTDTTTLRPGMRIYSRTGKTWTPGTIFSAKVDPAKLSNQLGSAVPLIYHIQFENGKEDPNINEEDVMSKTFYEEAILELEKCPALTNTKDGCSTVTATSPLEMGTPVYCQWRDMQMPEIHGRWLPGTVNSYQKINAEEYSYHILFDNEHEKRGIPQKYVIDRTSYHELVKMKHQVPPEEGGATRAIGEIYNLFLQKESSNTDCKERQQRFRTIQGSVVTENSISNDPDHTEKAGQLDLLFTASQMATSNVKEPSMATVAKKRESIADIGNDVHKRQRQQQVTAMEQGGAKGGFASV